MGAVLGAVSPAVVIPRMVQLMDEKYGTQKAIPQMIMAGASCDDIFVIVLFTTFLSMAQGGSANLTALLNIPVSIILGILLGAVVGYGLCLLFETAYARRHYVRNSMKVIIVLGFSFLLIAIEGWLEGKIAISGLLAVVSMACVLKSKSTAFVSKRLSEKFGKLWLAAEVILFVLVGAAVDIRYTLEAGLSAVLMIFIALVFRTSAYCSVHLKPRLPPKSALSALLPICRKPPSRPPSAPFPLQPDCHAAKSCCPLQSWLLLLQRHLGLWEWI